MHDAVSAEPVGEVEARYAWRGAEDRVMIGRHLVKSGPRALRVHFGLLQTGHAIHAASENFLDERWIELGLEPRRFLRIVPGQQQPQPFRAEMEAGRHI